MVNGTRICELSECRQPFRPKRSWQLCCCPNHGTRLRYLRRRDRLRAIEGMRVIRGMLSDSSDRH